MEEDTKLNYDEIYNKENYDEKIAKLIESSEFQDFYSTLTEEQKKIMIAKKVVKSVGINEIIKTPFKTPTESESKSSLDYVEDSKTR